MNFAGMRSQVEIGIERWGMEERVRSSKDLPIGMVLKENHEMPKKEVLRCLHALIFPVRLSKRETGDKKNKRGGYLSLGRKRGEYGESRARLLKDRRPETAT